MPIVTSNPVISSFIITGSDLFGKLMSNRIPVKADGTFTSDGQSSTSQKTFTASVDAKGNPTKIRTYYNLGGGFGFTTTDLYSYLCP